MLKQKHFYTYVKATNTFVIKGNIWERNSDPQQNIEVVFCQKFKIEPPKITFLVLLERISNGETFNYFPNSMILDH